MTRVLYWNIEKFAFNKVANTSTAMHHDSYTEGEAASARATYITNVIAAVEPHIIVVVEISIAFTQEGTLAGGMGLAGCFELLDLTRSALDPPNVGTSNWMMVPPLQTGPNEAVAVLYDKRNRFFSGPNRWSGGVNGQSARPPADGKQYPTNLKNALPSRTVPGGSLHNAGRSERILAARTDFTVSAAAAQNAGGAMDWLGKRAPYMVTFAETDGTTFKRNLTVFGIHSPSKMPSSGAFLDTKLPECADIVDNLDADECRLVVGDFNVNLLKSDDQKESARYAPLQTAGYTLLLKPLNAPPNPLNGYEGYFATHIRSKDYAECWTTNTPKSTDYYPVYGYGGTHRRANTFAIDNAFARYGANLNPPADHKFTVVNPVVGSPYTANPAPKQGTPKGKIGFDRQINLPPPAKPPATGPPFNIGLQREFRSWDNYWYLRSTSDHLALVMDV